MSSICIINNFNYARYIGECIESALQQVHPFDKILIVDDGSTDHTGDIAHELKQRYPQLKIARHAGALAPRQAARV